MHNMMMKSTKRGCSLKITIVHTDQRHQLSLYRSAAGHVKIVTFKSILQLEQKHTQSLWFPLNRFKETIHQLPSFILWSASRADEDEGRERNLSEAVCCRLIIGTSLMLICCSKRLRRLLNQWFSEKMISCKRQNDFHLKATKGSCKRSDTHTHTHTQLYLSILGCCFTSAALGVTQQFESIGCVHKVKSIFFV